MVTWIIRWIRPNQVGSGRYARRLFAKGFMPFLRGTLHRSRLADVDGLFFLGRKTRIIGARDLHAGRNVYIGDFSYLDCSSQEGVHLGDNVTIREFAWLQMSSQPTEAGTRLDVGDGTYIGPRCYLGAGAPIIIGRECQLGGGVSLVAEQHEFRKADLQAHVVTRVGIIIERGCWLGNNVTVLDGVTVGEGTIIAANAVVTKDVPAYSLAMGIPARAVPIE